MTFMKAASVGSSFCDKTILYIKLIKLGDVLKTTVDALDSMGCLVTERRDRTF